jgi:hypothetical protein
MAAIYLSRKDVSRNCRTSTVAIDSARYHKYIDFDVPQMCSHRVHTKLEQGETPVPTSSVKLQLTPTLPRTQSQSTRESLGEHRTAHNTAREVQQSNYCYTVQSGCESTRSILPGRTSR